MTIESAIIGMIEDEKPACGKVTETSNLCTDLGFDSLAFVQLLLKIEGVFSLTFSLMEMGICLQVDRLIALVQSKQKEAAYDSALIDEPAGLGQDCCD